MRKGKLRRISLLRLKSMILVAVFREVIVTVVIQGGIQDNEFSKEDW